MILATVVPAVLTDDQLTDKFVGSRCRPRSFDTLPAPEALEPLLGQLQFLTGVDLPVRQVWLT